MQSAPYCSPAKLSKAKELVERFEAAVEADQAELRTELLQVMAKFRRRRVRRAEKLRPAVGSSPSRLEEASSAPTLEKRSAYLQAAGGSRESERADKAASLRPNVCSLSCRGAKREKNNRWNLFEGWR